MRWGILFSLILLTSCCVQPPETEPELDEQLTAWFQWSRKPGQSATEYERQNFHYLPREPLTRPGWLDTMSTYDFLSFGPDLILTDGWSGVIPALKERNPKLKVVSYSAMIHVYHWQKKSAEAGWLRSGTLAHDWWYGLTPFLARTNELDPATAELDTFAAWHRDYVVNPLIEAAQDSFVAISVRYRGDVDGFMLDWSGMKLYDFKKWQPPAYAANEYGEPDLDGDGVAHDEDQDEQAALRQAWHSIARKLRVALPDGFLLIPNGELAVRDPGYARLVDGVYVERAPNPLTQGYSNDWDQALDPMYSRSLFTLTEPDHWYRGSGLVFLEDRYDVGFYEEIAALFPGAVAVKRPNHDRWIVRPTRELDLGNPVDARCQRVGTVLSRGYERGEVFVDVGTPGRPRVGVVPHVEEE